VIVRITTFENDLSGTRAVSDIIEISPLTSDLVFRGRLRRALDRQINELLEGGIESITVEIDRADW
jgi:hypothetical protein